jgi:hypothetical protein
VGKRTGCVWHLSDDLKRCRRGSRSLPHRHHIRCWLRLRWLALQELLASACVARHFQGLAVGDGLTDAGAALEPGLGVALEIARTPSVSGVSIIPNRLPATLQRITDQSKLLDRLLPKAPKPTQCWCLGRHRIHTARRSKEDRPASEHIR